MQNSYLFLCKWGYEHKETYLYGVPPTSLIRKDNS